MFFPTILFCFFIEKKDIWSAEFTQDRTPGMTAMDRWIDWEKEDFKLAIIGISCAHTDVIKKKHKKGIIKIAPGGPISSDPIFVHVPKSGEQVFQLKDN